LTKKLLEERTKQLDEQMKNCKHPPKQMMTLSSGKNKVCGLCGMVF